MHILDKQARYYPISLIEPQPTSDTTRNNIRNISDATIVLQTYAQSLQNTDIQSWQSIVVEICVSSQRVIKLRYRNGDQPSTDEGLSFQLVRIQDTYISIDGCSRIYVQPGCTLVPDTNTWLRLNASCIIIYTTPAKLQVHSKSPGIIPDIYTKQNYIKYTIQNLVFDASGYNTSISYGSGSLTIAGSPGIGLGRHPVDSTIYDAAQLQTIAQALQPVSGLISINGHSGDVVIRGQGSVSVNTQLVNQNRIELSISRT